MCPFLQDRHPAAHLVGGPEKFLSPGGLGPARGRAGSPERSAAGGGGEGFPQRARSSGKSTAPPSRPPPSLRGARSRLQRAARGAAGRGVARAAQCAIEAGGGALGGRGGGLAEGRGGRRARSSWPREARRAARGEPRPEGSGGRPERCARGCARLCPWRCADAGRRQRPRPVNCGAERWPPSVELCP